MKKEQLIPILHEKGYKVTPQRLAICEEVLFRYDHPTAEQVYAKVTKQYPTMSMTTIYHTLNMLKDMGLVDELRFDGRPSRFDPNTSVHINVICQKCNKIWDYESEEIQTHWAHIISEIGAEPIGQRMDVYILCEECRKSNGD